MIVDIPKIQPKITELRARIKQMRIETEKMRKESVWYPWLQICTTAVAGMLAIGAVMFFVGKAIGGKS